MLVRSTGDPTVISTGPRAITHHVLCINNVGQGCPYIFLTTLFDPCSFTSSSTLVRCYSSFLLTRSFWLCISCCSCREAPESSFRVQPFHQVREFIIVGYFTHKFFPLITMRWHLLTNLHTATRACA